MFCVCEWNACIVCLECVVCTIRGLCVDCVCVCSQVCPHAGWGCIKLESLGDVEGTVSFGDRPPGGLPFLPQAWVRAPGTCISPVKGLRPGSWDNVLSARGCPSPARPVSAQCPWAPMSEGHPLGPWKGLITPKCTKNLSLPQNIARWTKVPGISECLWEGRKHKSSEEN